MNLSTLLIFFAFVSPITALPFGCSTSTDTARVQSAFVSNSSVAVTLEFGGYRFEPKLVNASRGLIWIPDGEVSGEAYGPYCRRVAEAGFTVFLLTDPLCLAEGPRRVIFATAIQRTMLDYPREYWALVGHGSGVEQTSRQVSLYYPRVRGLVALAADPTQPELVGQRLMTIVVNGNVVDQSKLDNHTLYQNVVNSTSGDFAFTLPSSAQKNSTYSQVSPNIVAVMSLLQYPNHLPEVWRYTNNSTYSYDAVRKWHVFTPVNGTVKTGYIFYVGAAVPETAYLGWANNVAQFGYQVVLPVFPLNYAPGDLLVADRVMAAYPNITKWAVGGHSLGSVSASLYLCLRAPGAAPPPLAQPKLRGAVYLAGALICNLTQTSIKFAHTYGTNDLPASSAAAGGYDRRFRLNLLPFLPPFDGTFPLFVPIEGGNHNNMGRYGCPSQAGDGIATVSHEYQQDVVTNTIVRTLSAL